MKTRSILARIFQIVGIGMFAFILLANIIAWGICAAPAVVDLVTNRVYPLANRVSAISPDRKFALICEVDGTVRIEEVSDRKIVASNNVDIRRYRNIEVKWTEPNRIEVIADLRYPYLADAVRWVWDSQLRMIEKSF